MKGILQTLVFILKNSLSCSESSSSSWCRDSLLPSCSKIFSKLKIVGVMSIYTTPSHFDIKKVKHVKLFPFLVSLSLLWRPSYLSSQGVQTIFGGSEAVLDDIIAKIRLPLLTYQVLQAKAKLSVVSALHSFLLFICHVARDCGLMC